MRLTSAIEQWRRDGMPSATVYTVGHGARVRLGRGVAALWPDAVLGAMAEEAVPALGSADFPQSDAWPVLWLESGDLAAGDALEARLLVAAAPDVAVLDEPFWALGPQRRRVLPMGRAALWLLMHERARDERWVAFAGRALAATAALTDADVPPVADTKAAMVALGLLRVLAAARPIELSAACVLATWTTGPGSVEAEDLRGARRLEVPRHRGDPMPRPGLPAVAPLVAAPAAMAAMGAFLERHPVADPARVWAQTERELVHETHLRVGETVELEAMWVLPEGYLRVHTSTPMYGAAQQRELRQAIADCRRHATRQRPVAVVARLWRQAGLEPPGGAADARRVDAKDGEGYEIVFTGGAA